MVIASVDIETYKWNKKKEIYEPVLNPKKFIIGALLIEGKEIEYYTKPQELWKRIIEIGEKLQKQKKVLNIYGHNMRYDYYGIVDLEQEGITYNSEKPFIVTYEKEGKTAIKYLDTMNIYRMSLEKAGEIIGERKEEMPKEIRNVEEIKPYLKKDVEITLKLIQQIRKKNEENNIRIKRLYTIRQVAINYTLQAIKKIKDYPLTDLFYNAEKNQLHHTRYEEEIINAYRGGSVRCFQTGRFPKTTWIDRKMAYGKAGTEIKMPKLNSERKIKEPLKIYKLDALLEKIGITKCRIKNEKDELGIIPIRVENQETKEPYTHYLQKGQTGIGTWTNIELKEAIKNGHKIEKIEWSILWEETENPFRKIYPEIYKLRETGNKFDKWYYKEILVGGLGKFGQRKTGKSIEIGESKKAK